MKTLIKLSKKIALDDDEATLKAVGEFIMDEAFPVSTVFLVDGDVYIFTGLKQRVIGEAFDAVMWYVEADEPIDVTDRVKEPLASGIGYNVVTGETFKTNEDGTEKDGWEGKPHSELREIVTWGTRGKFGDQPVKRVAIKDMDTDHIEACLETQFQMSPSIRAIMENELKFRREN